MGKDPRMFLPLIRPTALLVQKAPVADARRPFQAVVAGVVVVAHGRHRQGNHEEEAHRSPVDPATHPPTCTLPDSNSGAHVCLTADATAVPRARSLQQTNLCACTE